MIETIFGNATAAKVMLYLYHYGEAYASAISLDMNITKSQVIKQLNKFEASGILVSKLLGRVRVYTFNPKLGVTKKLRDLIGVFYEAISPSEREEMFSQRRRPRRKDKPVISKKKKN